MDNKLEVFGITGTNGSGKGTVVEFLKQKGFKHYSASELILEEIVKLIKKKVEKLINEQW